MPAVQFSAEVVGRGGLTTYPYLYAWAEFGSGATQRCPAPVVVVTVRFVA